MKWVLLVFLAVMFGVAHLLFGPEIYSEIPLMWRALFGKDRD